MLIAIDYDKTWTLDPHLWEIFAGNCRLYGHRLICVTGRHPSQPVPLQMPIVYAHNEFKRRAAERAGYKVDIWIDDMPGVIEDTRILSFDDDGATAREDS
ncbi:MAG: hypothetical protein Q8L20_11100 [Gammaproteobacteria bacterium]|nr:hypothetical protein [Gammaproteobacteria bacterium]